MFTKSLRLTFKLALLVLPPVMIPLICIGWFANKDLRDDTYRTALEQMQDGMELVTYKVGALVTTARSSAELLANYPQLQRYVPNQGKKQRESLLQSSLLQMFHGYQHAYPRYHRIRLLLPDDFEGMRVAKTARGNVLTEKEGAQAYYQNLIKMNGDLITDIRLNPDTGKRMLYVFRRLHDTSAGSQSVASGFLELMVSLENLYSDLERHKIGKEGRILLVDKKGEIFFDTHHQATRSRLSRVIWNLVQTTDYFIRPRKYYFLNQTFLIQAKALDSQLYALIAFPSDELEEPIIRPRIAILLATLSVLILYTNLVYGGLQRLILRPLKELNRATTEIANGNFRYALKVSSADELGDMANTINSIGKKLAAYSRDHGG